MIFNELLSMYANSKNISLKTFKNAKSVIKNYVNISIKEFIKNHKLVILNVLNSNLAPLTKIEYLKTIRKLLNFAYNFLNLPLRVKRKIKEAINYISMIIKSIPKIPKIPLHEKIIKIDEFKKLLNVANSYEKCILYILFSTGIRRSELRNLRVKDFEIYRDHVVINVYSSKTKTFRKVIITDKKAINVIKNVVMKFKLHYGDNYELFNIDVNYMLRRLCKLVNVRKITCHMFRHTCATFLSKILPEIIVKKFMGWSVSSNIISKYVHLSYDDVIHVVKRFKLLKHSIIML